MILFFVWTDIQLVNCINVKCNYYKNENAELIAYKRGRISERLLEIVREKRVFSDIYFLELPDFYDEDSVNKMNRFRYVIAHLYLKRYLSQEIKALIENKKFTIFLVASFWSETLTIYKNVRKYNKNIQIEIVEEGMANYTGSKKWIYRAAPSSAIKAILREFFYCGFLGIEARKKVRCMYLYQPKLMWTNSDRNIKKLPIIDKKNDIVFGIFEEWQENFDNSLYEKSKIIYIADEIDLDKKDRAVLKNIVQFLPKVMGPFMIVKLHPSYSFKGTGKIEEGEKGIWIDYRNQQIENILFRCNVENKILVINHSSVLLYLKCMLGKEPCTIFTYKIQENNRKGIVKRFNFFAERLGGIFENPDRLTIPDTMEELQRILKRLLAI